tara:strand:- start:309 stop:758 length:450 start_codon:yes stop_codon:yes gene_type:complete
LNILLSLNKNFVLVITILFFIILFIFIILKFYFSYEYKNSEIEIKISNADITEPRFAINNPSKKIFVTAQEGNFIKGGKILLKNNVKFTSENFSIETDNVVFDRQKQTASSDDKSVFKSKNTIISSDGFDIYDSGNIINFYGKAVVTLK